MPQFCILFFFFQAEDGIRDRNVTGVQTCALPIFLRSEITIRRKCNEASIVGHRWLKISVDDAVRSIARRRVRYLQRSEERRVGKECRSRGSADHCEEK